MNQLICIKQLVNSPQIQTSQAINNIHYHLLFNDSSSVPEGIRIKLCNCQLILINCIEKVVQGSPLIHVSTGTHTEYNSKRDLHSQKYLTE